MTIELPTLLLTPNVASVFEICARMQEATDPVTCDASHLIVAEPMALCVSVATLSRMQRLGRNVRVVGLSPEFKQQMESLDILSRSLFVCEHERRAGYQGTLYVYRVKSERDLDVIGNKIAQAIVARVPSPKPAISAFEQEMKDSRIIFPLAYLITELVDNGVRHGRGRGYHAANVWVAAQYHPPPGADSPCGGG
jgi:hypothetical protein